MATSLVVPIAYITVLVAGLAIFSRVYRRRRAAEKTSFEPWFPSHPTRDVYITLLSSTPAVPDSLLKSALLVRATADVRRIWRLRDDKGALASLHARGLVGDDTMARFAAAEKELEAEIVDVVAEANTFRQGWGQMIFATATEMAHAQKTRETVVDIAKVKAAEDKRIAYAKSVLSATPALPASASSSFQAAAAPAAPAAPVAPVPAHALGHAHAHAHAGSAAPSPATSAEGSPNPNAGAGSAGSASSTPSKSTPSKKKKNKK
ncbi:Translocation protein S66 [Cryptotrichosporon argae]